MFQIFQDLLDIVLAQKALFDDEDGPAFLFSCPSGVGAVASMMIAATLIIYHINVSVFLFLSLNHATLCPLPTAPVTARAKTRARMPVCPLQSVADKKKQIEPWAACQFFPYLSQACRYLLFREESISFTIIIIPAWMMIIILMLMWWIE